MDRLDRFVEDTLIPKYSREEKREIHPIYLPIRRTKRPKA